MNTAPLEWTESAASEPALAFAMGDSGASAALARLIANLPGFVYRGRADRDRTMDFVSERCRDLLGYDPHRFYGNQSLTYGWLIHSDDQERVEAHVLTSARRGRQFTACYRLIAAFGRFVPVIDRGVGVLDETGSLVAIEGYVSRADGDGSKFAGGTAVLEEVG